MTFSPFGLEIQVEGKIMKVFKPKLINDPDVH